MSEDFIAIPMMLDQFSKEALKLCPAELLEKSIATASQAVIELISTSSEDVSGQKVETADNVSPADVSGHGVSGLDASARFVKYPIMIFLIFIVY